MCPGMSCRTRRQRACPWPPALPRACWDTLAEPHWPPPALAPAGPRYQGRASTASHFPALLGALLSRSLPGRMEAAVGLSVRRACPSPGARAGPLPPCPAALGHHEEVGGGPAEPGPVLISLEPRYRPTRAAVFLHFANGEEQLRLHKEALREQQSAKAEAGIRRAWVPLLSPPFSLCPHSLACVRPAASRLVPWPSPPTPRTLPASPWVGAGWLHEAFKGGAGRGERGFSSGAILTEVGVTPPHPRRA